MGSDAKEKLVWWWGGGGGGAIHNGLAGTHTEQMVCRSCSKQ